jgi:hypothetical protein
MTMTDQPMAIPWRFGGTWEAFLQTHGKPPGADPSEVVKCLFAIDELWPEAGDNILRGPIRGEYASRALVELGRSLNAVRACSGFDRLLCRLKKMTQGAHAELITAATLIRLGLEIRLEVSVGNRVLDAAIDHRSTTIYVEVTAPNRSKSAEEQERLQWHLIEALRDAGRGFGIFIEFFDDPAEALVAELIATVREHSSSTEWVYLRQSARYRRIPTSPGNNDQFEVVSPGIDRRTERVVREEYDQLVNGAPNLLVIDMSTIGSSVFEWRDAIVRLLQPTKNRRISAVALFESLFSGRLWWVISNPYAHHPIPPDVLDAIRTLEMSADDRKSNSSPTP